MVVGFFLTQSRRLFLVGVCLGFLTQLVMYLAQWRKYHRVAGLSGLRSQDRQVEENIYTSRIPVELVVLAAGAALAALYAAFGRAVAYSIISGWLGGLLVSMSLLLSVLLLRARIHYGREHDVTEIN
jgi:hypothetical protein